MAERRILLLQGPLGPFFNQFARQLLRSDCRVWKINFNGGDWLFGHSRDYERITNYRGRVDDWPAFLRDYLLRYRITDCVVYGDCRYYHQQAWQVSTECRVRYWAFEEGYLRPDFITLEPGRVNSFSELDRRQHIVERHQYDKHDSRWSVKPMGATFLRRMLYAMLYYLALAVARRFFPEYRHHRQGGLLREAACWLRSGWRKLGYGVSQRDFARRFSRRWHKRYFFVPLQVHNDAQILYHSRFTAMEPFMREVMQSFAAHAAREQALLFKHHPIDRGFRHYRRFIEQEALRLGIDGRVFYCFDAHLPTLERHALGAVTINSTVGLSCLINQLPVKVLGKAIYSDSGVTSELPLDAFWREPGVVNSAQISRLKHYLWQQTQVNGNFYKHLQWSTRQAASSLLHTPLLPIAAPAVDSRAVAASAPGSARPVDADPVIEPLAVSMD